MSESKHILYLTYRKRGQMAKIITHHDPYHIHKILGVLALLHYVYRFTLLFKYGDAFPSSVESPLVSACGVALHGLLSWSSLLLPLPTKRNFTKPMIWPEFRLHSITFATRHVVTTILTLLNVWPDEENYIFSALTRAVVVLGAVKAASIITDRYGDREQRTTNSMPYPKTVEEGQRPGIKKSYALAQFGATAVCLLPDASLNFAPLLAIQMAPLMMTLVRKGKVSSGTYHRVYAISLYLGYVMVFVRLLARNSGVEGEECGGVSKSVGLKTIFMLCFPSSKLRKLVSAYMVWTTNVMISTMLYPMFMAQLIDATVSHEAAMIMFWFVTVVGTAKQLMIYAPLFGITRLHFSMSIQQNDTLREIEDESMRKEKAY